MTKLNIKKYHRIIGYLNLILSILYLVFSRDTDLIERFFTGIVMNLVYHMYYYFFSTIYKHTTKVRLLNKFNKVGLKILLKCFSLSGILGSGLLLILFISDAIRFYEYFKLFSICIPFGLFLGANSLLNDTREEKEQFTT